MALTQISTAGVKDDAVTSGKIPANAVGSSELADNAVDSAALAADCVIGSKIADSQIATEHIVNDAVTTAKIADDAVGHDQIADNSIHHHHIANGTIVADDLADDAVTSAKIADNAVVADRIADTTITTQKLANSAINTDKLNDNAVTSAKIVDEAVTLDKLPHGTASNDGKFLRANNNADPSWVATAGFNRNLVINGAMTIAQRGTSHTSSGYRTVDRFKMQAGNASATLTQAQINLTAGSPDPRHEGFYKAYKITNNGQSANNQGYCYIIQLIEAQNVVQSGWRFASSDSYITLSFWVRTSVAQNYLFSVYTSDGTNREYNWLESLSANVWTKVTKTIPGDSNISIDNDNGPGLELYWHAYLGDHYTSGSTVNQWVNHAGYTSRPDMDSTWWTTSNSTYELTGVQLEAGSQATPFAHRSITEEQQLCKRYYQQYGGSADHWHFGIARAESNTARAAISVPVPMRTSPTVASAGGHRTFDRGYNSESTDTPGVYDVSGRNNNLTDAIYTVDFPGHSLTHNRIYALMSKSSNTSDFTLDAEM